jgi:hypothetical protein
LLGVVTIVLSITGLLHFFFPKIIKRQKRKKKPLKKPAGELKYLAGSFNGLFFRDLHSGRISDFFTGAPHTRAGGVGNPIGDNMAAGWVEAGENGWWFDYNRGALPLSEKPFPEMPLEIRNESPMSLWNVSQEIHTGRIFEHLVGPFYILFVPLAGLCLIMVLVSGFFIWWKAHRNKAKKNS